MPKNWSFSLLKKRVQTSQGVGVVVEVIDKGWISVRLEGSGKRIKTRPGNVTALEGDEVISTFAKKTKATHAIKTPVLLPGATLDWGAEVNDDTQSSDSGGGGGCGGGGGEAATVVRGTPTSHATRKSMSSSSSSTPSSHGSKGKGRKVFVAKRTLAFNCPVRSRGSEGGDNDDEGDDESIDVLGDDELSGSGGLMSDDPQESDDLDDASGVTASYGDLPHLPKLMASPERRRRSLKIGAAVEAMNADSRWSAGLVDYEHDDGTYSVLLDNGDVLSYVPRAKLRAAP